MALALPEGAKQTFGILLKLIGVAIFIAILRTIDFTGVLGVLKSANVTLLVVSFLLLLASYGAKTLRWHLLVQSGGLHPTLTESWRLYTIGIFLGNLTPSNLGELGRIPYLTKRGMPLHTATLTIALDRILDVLIMGVIAVISVGILYGSDWLLIGLVACLPFAFLAWLAWRKTHVVRAFLKEFGFLPTLFSKPVIARLLLMSTLVWALYFAWTCTLAYALGITVAIPELAAAITLTAAVALIPIAPAGLGTRDAAMLTFLVPLGVRPELSIAFSLLFFVWVILSCIPGLISWLQGLPEAKKTGKTIDVSRERISD